MLPRTALRRLSTVAVPKNVNPAQKEAANTMTKVAASTSTYAIQDKNQLYKRFASNEFVSPYDFTSKGHTTKARGRFVPPILAPRSKEVRAQDPFYQLQIDPLEFSLNPKVLNRYLTQMGKIQPRTRTELTTKSQRRLAKAIRRAKVMGIIPIFSRRFTFD